MKKRFIALLIVFSFLSVQTVSAQTAESIQLFKSDIVVHTDGSTSVTEVIVYDFGNQERHGIFREIPATKAPGARGDLKIHDASVVDENGISYPVDTDYSDGLYIKIGDPDKTITGVHTYKISYITERSIGYFDTFDELYWNVSGNDWNVPIKEINARITLPVVVPVEQLKSASYCGTEGNSSSCGTTSVVHENGTTVVDFSSNDFLEANQVFDIYRGMTVAVGFPKGVVFEKPFSWWKKETAYYYIAGIGFGLILMFFIWWIVFVYMPLRRTYIRSIVPEYDVPKDVTPSLAGFAYKRGFISTSRMAMADLLYLATEGYITIEVQKTKKLFKEVSEFILSRTTKVFPGQGAIASLYGFLTEEGSSVVLGKNTDKKLYEKFDSYAEKIKKAYKSDNPDVVKLQKKYTKIIILCVILGFAIGFTSVIFGGKDVVPLTILLPVLVIGLSLLISLIIRYFMHTRLVARTDLWYHMAGLRYYIKIAEQDRIKFHSDPENSLRIFSHLLPYAVLFGLEDKWVKLFDGIIPELDWYKDSSGGFSSYAFLASMHSFNSSVSSSVNIGRPASDGSSGGGSSGGGGGGGGGGSW